MRTRPRPFDIVHVSSAHPWTDNRIHRRAAATAAAAGYRTALVAVTTGGGVDRDWGRPDPETGVWVRRIASRPRRRRVVVSSVQVIAAALSSRARVVHLHDPELVWAVPVLRLAARVVVYDAHEDLPDQVRGKEYLGPVVRRLAVTVARLVVVAAGRADAVVAATPTIATRFPRGRTTIVRNLPVLRQVDLDAPAAPDRPTAAVYLGSLSRDRGVEVIADVAGSDTLPAGWRVVTAGPMDAAVDRRRFDALHRGGRIDHRGVLEPTDARDLLLHARVGLLPLLPTPAYAASIPTKLFEYMAAGLAVVATDIPLWRELLGGATASADCATWVPPGDADAVVRAIRRYADDPSLLAAHAEAGRNLVYSRYRWQDDAAHLLRLYGTTWGIAPFGTRNGM
jgi:glycosyltransferase involved in cell wall biosynthesis